MTPTILSDSVIKRLFAEMNAIYGFKWRSLFPDEDSLKLGRSIWAQKLGGLTKIQLRRGVESCAYLSDWNPSVAEFVRAACDLPSLGQCVSRVTSDKNIDLVSYRIAGKIGKFNLRMMTMQDQRRTIANHYDDVYAQTLSEVMGSDEKFEPPVLLADKVKSNPANVADEGTAKSHIDSMRETLGAVNG